MFFPVVLFSCRFTIKPFGKFPLEFLARGMQFHLLVHGVKVQSYDNDNEKKADPEHHTLRREECCPEQDNEGDQVKNDPCPEAGQFHIYRYVTRAVINPRYLLTPVMNGCICPEDYFHAEFFPPPCSGAIRI